MTRIEQIMLVGALLLCPVVSWAALHTGPPIFLGDGSVRVRVEADAPMDVDSLQFNLPGSFAPISLTETPAASYQALDQTIAPATVLFFGLQTFHIDPGPVFHWDFKPADARDPLAGFAPTYVVDDGQPLPLSPLTIPEPETWMLLACGMGLLSIVFFRCAAARAGRRHSK